LGAGELDGDALGDGLPYAPSSIRLSSVLA
jgi:hypothetical protein